VSEKQESEGKAEFRSQESGVRIIRPQTTVTDFVSFLLAPDSCFTTMYPELFRIGTFPINTYGVLLAIAFLAGLLITAKLASRDGLPRERIYDLGLWMLLA